MATTFIDPDALAANAPLLADQVLPGPHRVRYELNIAPSDYPSWPDDLTFVLQDVLPCSKTDRPR